MIEHHRPLFWYLVLLHQKFKLDVGLLDDFNVVCWIRQRYGRVYLAIQE